MSTCTTDAPHNTSAAPGSTEWIKAHLARMDRPAPPDEDIADRRN